MNDDVIALIKKYRKLTLKIDNTNIEIDNVFNKKSNKKENILFCFFVFSFYAYLFYNFNTIIELNIIQSFINNIQEVNNHTLKGMAS